MGHFCKICKKILPNERFSGKGHKIHICKKCKTMPKEKRNKILLKDEIANLLNQSNISKKNIERLSILSNSECNEVAEFATLVLKIGKVKSGRKRRLGFLKKYHHDIYTELTEKYLFVLFYK